MPAEARVGIDVIITCSVAVALACVCMLVGDTTVGIALSLVIIPLLIYAASRVPIRRSLMVLMWLALVLPNPSEGIMTGKWDGTLWLPPFVPLGAIVLDHINVFDRSSPLLGFCSFSGMDISFVTLGLIVWFRKTTGSTIDSAGRAPTPLPLIHLAWLSLGTMMFVWTYGMLTGGDFKNSLWQLNAVMYIPITFLLWHTALRGPADYRGIAKVVLSAAFYKSLLAVFVWWNIHDPPDPTTHLIQRVAYGTCHADSILFADATLLVIAMLLEHQKVKLWAVVLLPVFIAGMAANNRRLVWVQVALVLITVYVISKDNPAKRMIRRWLKILSPVLLAYTIAGWHSVNGMTFKPVRILHSVIDAKSDASSFWRELENFNLLTTWQRNMIFGSGYGHPYVEFVAMPYVDYTLEQYVPHNSILGLWAFTGLVGYAGLTLLWPGGVYFAMRAYHAAKPGPDRVAALVCFGSVFVWLMMCFGDLGLGLWAGIFTVAPSFAMAGKLAVVLGEWTPKRGKRGFSGPAVR